MPHFAAAPRHLLLPRVRLAPSPFGTKRKRSTPGLSEDGGLVSRRARRLLGLTWAVPVGAEYES